MIYQNGRHRDERGPYHMSTQKGIQKVLWLVLFLVAALCANHCMVKSKCYSDRDCPEPYTCIQGTCAYECTDEIACPIGMICQNHQCRKEDGSQKDFAPDFTLIDVNPYSPTYNDPFTLSDYRGDVVLLYFGQAG